MRKLDQGSRDRPSIILSNLTSAVAGCNNRDPNEDVNLRLQVLARTRRLKGGDQNAGFRTFARSCALPAARLCR